MMRVGTSSTWLQRLIFIVVDKVWSFERRQVTLSFKHCSKFSEVIRHWMFVRKNQANQVSDYFFCLGVEVIVECCRATSVPVDISHRLMGPNPRLG